MNGNGECSTIAASLGGSVTRVDWLGPKVGGRPTLVLHSWAGTGGTRPPQNFGGGCYCKLSLPDFDTLQNFAHQKVGLMIFFARSTREIVPRTNTVHIVWCVSS